MVQSFIMGVLTMNQNGAITKVGELEKVSLDITGGTHKRTVSDQRQPAEIIPTDLGFQIQATRAYFEPGMTWAILKGRKLEGVLYGKKGEDVDPVPLRALSGVILTKLSLGDFDGQKHVTEDFTAECSTVTPLDGDDVGGS